VDDPPRIVYLEQVKVLFVILDTLRPDYLEPYGSSWVKTPNIARLAERSVVCDNHWVGSLPCMPARREFMTGRHNFLERGWGPIEPFDDVLPQLLGQLKPKPVFSHLITDHYHYFYLGGEGHNSSFNSWHFERGQEHDLWVSRVDLPALPEALGSNKLAKQNALNRFAQQVEEELPGPRCVQAAVQWLDNNRGSDNWFMQLELFDPHEPFYAMQKYLDLYGDTWTGPIYDWPEYSVVKDDPSAIEHIRTCYAALLTMTDHWLGRLWDKLDEQNLWQDTVVVLTTDHGTMLAEHQYWMKGLMPVYNEIARIPLIVHQPGSAGAGERVTALTQTTDLMPTFLDYFGAERPPHLHGTSLRPAIESNQAIHDSLIYGYFGMALNLTDGDHTYFRNPVQAEPIVYAYTAMPVGHHVFMSREELAQAELGRFLGHTYNIPVYKVPQKGKAPHRHGVEKPEDYQPLHEVYDLATDPAQEHPLSDPDLEGRLCELLRSHLDRVKAPPENWERLGL
jgi:arylsulfatase A-like enzyme